MQFRRSNNQSFCIPLSTTSKLSSAFNTKKKQVSLLSLFAPWWHSPLVLFYIRTIAQANNTPWTSCLKTLWKLIVGLQIRPGYMQFCTMMDNHLWCCFIFIQSPKPTIHHEPIVWRLFKSWLWAETAVGAVFASISVGKSVTARGIQCAKHHNCSYCGPSWAKSMQQPTTFERNA